MKYFLLHVLLIALFIISCEKEVSVSPPEPGVNEGVISISSDPSGTMIFLNGRNTGKLTPDSLTFLDPADYKITLKKKYFKDTTVAVSLSEDGESSVLVDILSNQSMYGKLFLKTTPDGAQVVLNDSLTSEVTPVTISHLLPGAYNVEFRLYNYRGQKTNAIVQSSKTNTYIVQLRDTSQWVDYQLTNSGIPSNSLSSIITDQNNIKWIGSYDKGVIRFDENAFTVYNKSNSQIPNNRINCLNVDDQNRVWVGTDNGIGIFNGSGWTVYNQTNSPLTSELIYRIRFDNMGNAWIGTAANLVKFDGTNWTFYNEPLGRDWITDMDLTDLNKIWIGTVRFGIFTLVNGDFIAYPESLYNYPTNSITSMAVDNFNNTWFCFIQDSTGRSGVSYWNGSSFNNFNIGSPGNKINHVWIDDDNNKWFSSTEGFVKYDTQNNLEVFNTTNSYLSSNYITSSVRDQQGNVWITTFGGGLNKYKPPQ